MAKAVLDTTILISAFLRKVTGGVSYELLRFAESGYELCLCDAILTELTAVLLRNDRKRARYRYSDSDVMEYAREVSGVGTLVDNLPDVRGVVRDPNDDVIIACAIAASAEYLVTRDKDLLSLSVHEGIRIITPEAFLQVLRGRPSR